MEEGEDRVSKSIMGQMEFETETRAINQMLINTFKFHLFMFSSND